MKQLRQLERGKNVLFLNFRGIDPKMFFFICPRGQSLKAWQHTSNTDKLHQHGRTEVTKQTCTVLDGQNIINTLYFNTIHQYHGLKK